MKSTFNRLPGTVASLKNAFGFGAGVFQTHDGEIALTKMLGDLTDQ
jgi:hypothetical protein